MDRELLVCFCMSGRLCLSEDKFKSAELPSSGTVRRRVLTAGRASTLFVVDSALIFWRNSSYFSSAVSRCKRFCNSVDTSCRTVDSPGPATLTQPWVMLRTCAITRSSRKSYGNVSLHSASSCTSRGINRPSLSCNKHTTDNEKYIFVKKIYRTFLTHCNWYRQSPLWTKHLVAWSQIKSVTYYKKYCTMIRIAKNYLWRYETLSRLNIRLQLNMKHYYIETTDTLSQK